MYLEPNGMNILELDRILLELLQIQNNLKKSINRNFLYKTLIEKQRDTKQLYNSIQSAILQLTDEISEEKVDYYKDTAKQAYIYIQQTLETKLKNTKRNVTLKVLVKIIIILRKYLSKVKMAAAAEIIKIASSLVPQYDGNGEKLNNIVAALTALQSVVTVATEPLAVQIILSKLEKKARSAVGNAPANIEVIKTNLKLKCKQQISSDVVLAKLNAIRQNGALNKYTTEVEELTTQLETAYLNDNIPTDTATKMANKAGIKALANGLKNQNTQIIIKAGTFSSLHEAIGRAAENDNDVVSNASVLYYNNNKSRGNHYPNNNNSQRGYQQGRGGRYNQSYRQGNYQYNQPWRQNNNQQQGNSNWRNSNWRNHQNQNSRNHNGSQHRPNNNSNDRNNQNRGRVYHASGEDERSDRQADENRQQNDFLEMVDRVNRSSP